MKTFLNPPWRVEKTSGEILVVDAKNMIVANFDISDPESLPGSPVEEEEKAYLFAAAPGIYGAAMAFLRAMSDPIAQLDESLLLRFADDLETATRKADVPQMKREAGA